MKKNQNNQLRRIVRVMDSISTSQADGDLELGTYGELASSASWTSWDGVFDQFRINSIKVRFHKVVPEGVFAVKCENVVAGASPAAPTTWNGFESPQSSPVVTKTLTVNVTPADKDWHDITNEGTNEFSKVLTEVFGQGFPASTKSLIIEYLYDISLK